MRAAVALATVALATLSGCIQVNIGSPSTTTTEASPPGGNGVDAGQQAAAEDLAVDFYWRPENPAVGAPVQFYSTIQGLGDRGVSDWHWDWGDGHSGNGTAPSHTWTAARLDGYDVVLRVLTSDGDVVEATRNVFVTAR